MGLRSYNKDLYIHLELDLVLYEAKDTFSSHFIDKESFLLLHVQLTYFRSFKQTNFIMWI